MSRGARRPAGFVGGDVSLSRYNAEEAKRKASAKATDATPRWLRTDPVEDFVAFTDDIARQYRRQEPHVPKPDAITTDLADREPTEQERTEAAVRRLLPLMRRAGTSPVDVYDGGPTLAERFEARCTVPDGRARRTLSGKGESPLAAYEALAAEVRDASRPTRRRKGKR